jgi:3-oxoacyl-[acyl-carrier protein] reductase
VIVEEAARRFGTIAGVLLNAGGGPPSASALGVSDEQWRDAFDLLVGGPLRLLRGLLPITQEGSSVLFVTATSVRQPVPGLAVSNVLRPGVAALVKMVALELAPGIRVNSLAPGRFDTAYVRRPEQVWAQESGVSEEADLPEHERHIYGVQHVDQRVVDYEQQDEARRQEAEG